MDGPVVGTKLGGRLAGLPLHHSGKVMRGLEAASLGDFRDSEACVDEQLLGTFHPKLPQILHRGSMFKLAEQANKML